MANCKEYTNYYVVGSPESPNGYYIETILSIKSATGHADDGKALTEWAAHELRGDANPRFPKQLLFCPLSELTVNKNGFGIGKLHLTDGALVYSKRDNSLKVIDPSTVHDFTEVDTPILRVKVRQVDEGY